MKEKFSKVFTWNRRKDRIIFTRQVIIKDLKLRKVRNNLRNLFLLFAEAEYFRLSTLCNTYLSKSFLTDSQKRRFEVIKKNRFRLYHSLTHSICSCAVCSSKTEDMAYIPSGKCWVCVNCLKNIVKKKKELCF